MLDTLRFITCGSVDDGKSTLIGRLLYESKQIFEDHLNEVKKASEKYGTQGRELDLALLVDGLQAEREQGITIDVKGASSSSPIRRDMSNTPATWPLAPLPPTWRYCWWTRAKG